jgi:hypothetical protein
MKEFKLDKTAVKKGNIKTIGNDFEYWQTKTYDERLSAIEYLRRLNYPELNETGIRIQRVYKIIERKQS